MTDYLDRLFSLDGRVAAVTGGSSGIGKAMARAIALAGASTVLIARRASALDDAVREFRSAGATVGRVCTDLGDRTGIRRAADEITEIFGEPDILISAAGINLRPPLPTMTLDEWDRTMEVNLTAPFLLGQHFGPGMAARGWGRIINVGSQQSVRAFGNSGGYGASKAGVVALTRSQAEAWAPSGVCCNSVIPGFVATPMTREVASDPVRSAVLAGRTMVGRNGQPADFEGIAVFLASGASDYVNGQMLFVDGGFSAT